MCLAAHCFLGKNSDLNIKAGNIQASIGAQALDNPEEPGRLSLSPIERILHPDWDENEPNYDADLALLKFKKDEIHSGTYIQPIRLWDSDNRPNVNGASVVGWGSADSTIRHENEPAKVELPTFTNEECLPGNGIVADRASSRTFCAGGNGSGSCFGDSGGGLFAKVNDFFYLIGIVSSSPTKDAGTACDVSKNTIYTNVLKFRNWIKEETSKKFMGLTKISQNIIQ